MPSDPNQASSPNEGHRPYEAQQAEFMLACSQPRYSLRSLVYDGYDMSVKNNVSLWLNLIDEEVNRELRPFIYDALFSSYVPTAEAERLHHLTRIADDIADSVYVLCGLANCLGIPLQQVFAEVHRSNMLKAVNGKVLRRADGKILKPEGWQPPNIKAIIQSQLG